VKRDGKKVEHHHKDFRTQGTDGKLLDWGWRIARCAPEREGKTLKRKKVREGFALEKV